MARQSASLISTRVDKTLKQQFVQSAEFNHQSPSEALRQAIQSYIRDARKAALERDSEAIRANGEDEADVLNWIAAHSIPDDGN
jgi:predicted transcriptional regulator